MPEDEVQTLIVGDYKIEHITHSAGDTLCNYCMSSICDGDKVYVVSTKRVDIDVLCMYYCVNLALDLNIGWEGDKWNGGKLVNLDDKN